MKATPKCSKLRQISKLEILYCKLFKFSVKEIAGGPRLYESKYVKDLV